MMVHEAASTTQATASGEVNITRYTLQADTAMVVPYEGSNAAAKAEFAQGFFPSVGSGLAFKGIAADGSLEFWGLTDRGPNADSPNAPRPDNPAVSTISKIFLAPSFTPSIATIRVDAHKARITRLMPLKTAAGVPISGRPLPFTAPGASGEVPLNDALMFEAARGGFDPDGLDSEGLAYDAASNVLWVADEYGPFIAKVDVATGRILQRYAPGTTAGDLPDVLRHRRANRGMEGLTRDAATGKLHGFLQSPIEPLDTAGRSVEATDSFDLDQDGRSDDTLKVRDFAPFVRWIVFDPATETSTLYAYPLAFPIPGQEWEGRRTGSAKLGDLAALGSNRFVVIEQGADAGGTIRHFLMLVEIPAQATDITLLGIELEQNSIDGMTPCAVPWSQIVPLNKRMLLDLDAAGWRAEKAEGLAVVDDHTLALTSDNDFGLRTMLVDADGNEVEGDPTACTVDATGAIVDDGLCAPSAVCVRVTRGEGVGSVAQLWLLRFPRPLSTWTNDTWSEA